MKAMAFLPAAAAAILAFNISTASSQGACQQDYQACMTSCSSKPVKTIQGGCFEGCKTKNNLCAERIYGKRPFNGTPSSLAEQKGQAKEALAKKPQEAPQEQQAAEERAPQQAPKPAPRQGAPAKC